MLPRVFTLAPFFVLTIGCLPGTSATTGLETVPEVEATEPAAPEAPNSSPYGDPSDAEPPEVMDSGLQVEPDPPASTDARCSILSPEDGAAFARGASVLFRSETMSDDMDYVIWSSSVYGNMVVGTEFEFILPEAEHEITMQIVEADGTTCTDRVTIVIGG